MIRMKNKITKPYLPIALIGMTGCGKTTVGRLTAKRMGLPLLDLDAYIEEQTGKTIPALFEQYGEAGFRTIETKLLLEALKGKEPFLLSCGGGIVLREENRRILKKHAIVVWVRRAPKEVLKSHRVLQRPPINGDRKRYYALMRQRTPLYKDCADYLLQNGNPGKASAKLCHRLQKLQSENDGECRTERPKEEENKAEL